MLARRVTLLEPPTMRAAYSDRMAWLLAEMSSLAYLEFENSEKIRKKLEMHLGELGFKLIRPFSESETQGFLARREQDKIAVLAFRGTEVKKWWDILTDLDFRFYRAGKGAKIHNGFQRAFACAQKMLEEEVRNLEKENFAIYITGHSLGGALALVAAKYLSSDNIAACYTFGSPRVGNSELGDTIKPPIYRIVNANDLVPRVPFPFIVELIYWISFFKSYNILEHFFSERGFYAHHGDQRYLTPCRDDFMDLRLVPNPGFIDARCRYFNLWRIGLGIQHHACDLYCCKLANYAVSRLDKE
ncbi:lipase family protein [Candidatus Velamenicoccus archaeovorus]|nr:lipase family protein [Candidatus Velamenicoccus archaeovorus]